jgi:hypothetical protein
MRLRLSWCGCRRGHDRAYNRRTKFDILLPDMKLSCSFRSYLFAFPLSAADDKVDGFVAAFTKQPA